MGAAFGVVDPVNEEQGLDRLRQTVVAQYDRVAHALLAARQGTEKIAEELARIAQHITLHGQADDPLQAVQGVIADLHARLPARAVLATGRAELPADEVAPGIEALELLQRESLKLMSVATMTMIHARSLGSAAFDDYVGNLRQTAAALEEGVTSVRQSLEAIRDARAQFDAGMDQARTRLAEAQAALNGQGSGRDDLALAEFTARAQLDATLRALAQAASTAVMVLVTRIQFSDELAQRLDHIGQILEWAARDRREAAMLALAGAQLVALAADGQENLANIDRSLEDLAQRCTEILRLGESGDFLRLSAELTRQRQIAVRMAEAARATVGPAIAGADTAARAQMAEAARASEQFHHLFAATENMAMSAHNARLITARALGGRGALTVLAVAVHESSDGCSQQIRVCQTVLERVEELIGQANAADLASASADLAHVVTDCAQALMRAEAAQGETAAAFAGLVQTGQSLLAALRQAQAATREVRGAIADLDRLGQSLGMAGAPNGTATGIANGTETLDDIAALYTMARERQVHDQLFGPQTLGSRSGAPAGTGALRVVAGGGSPPAPAPAPQTDLDDILF